MKNLFVIFALFIVVVLVCFFGPIRIIEGHGGGGHLGRGMRGGPRGFGYDGSRFGYGGSRFGYGRGISYIDSPPSYYLSADDEENDKYYQGYLYPPYF